MVPGLRRDPVNVPFLATQGRGGGGSRRGRPSRCGSRCGRARLAGDAAGRKDAPRPGDGGRSARLGLPACRPGKNPSVGHNATRPLDVNKAPSMYEMEGALLWPRRSGSASHPASLALRAARQRQAPRAINRFPGPFPRPRSCPQMVPVSGGESISTPSASCRARVCGHSFQVSSLSTRCPQNEAAYPHLTPVIHRFCTRNPQVT